MKPSIVSLTLVALTALTLAKAGALTAEETADPTAVEQAAETVVAEDHATGTDSHGTAKDDMAPDGEESQAVAVEPAAPAPLLPELLLDITAEREELAKRQEALDAREARIALAGDAVTRQIEDLRALKGELDELLGKTGSNHGTDVEQLVDIYRAMKPVQAAGIMNDLDLEVATLVIAAMDARTAGPILAVMNPERAQVISKIMFQRSRLPGDRQVVRVKAD